MLIQNKLLDDFSVWLNPQNLKLFNKRDILKKSYGILSKSQWCIDEDVQKELSHGLESSEQSRSLYALRVYFFQLYHFESFSLDLRPQSFFFSNGYWQHKSKRFSYTFTSDFISRMRDIYDDFYLNGAKNLEENLLKIGLMDKSWDREDQVELQKLFIEHFDSADKEKHHFEFAYLFTSFSQIFKFLSERQKVIPTDFAFLGVYLTSLYMTLNQSTEALDVKECFLMARSVEWEQI